MDSSIGSSSSNDLALVGLVLVGVISSLGVRVLAWLILPDNASRGGAALASGGGSSADNNNPRTAAGIKRLRPQSLSRRALGQLNSFFLFLVLAYFLSLSVFGAVEHGVAGLVVALSVTLVLGSLPGSWPLTQMVLTKRGLCLSILLSTMSGFLVCQLLCSSPQSKLTGVPDDKTEGAQSSSDSSAASSSSVQLFSSFTNPQSWVQWASGIQGSMNHLSRSFSTRKMTISAEDDVSDIALVPRSGLEVQVQSSAAAGGASMLIPFSNTRVSGSQKQQRIGRSNMAAIQNRGVVLAVHGSSNVIEDLDWHIDLGGSTSSSSSKKFGSGVVTILGEGNVLRHVTLGIHGGGGEHQSVTVILSAETVMEDVTLLSKMEGGGGGETRTPLLDCQSQTKATATKSDQVKVYCVGPGSDYPTIAHLPRQVLEAAFVDSMWFTKVRTFYLPTMSTRHLRTLLSMVAASWHWIQPKAIFFLKQVFTTLRAILQLIVKVVSFSAGCTQDVGCGIAIGSEVESLDWFRNRYCGGGGDTRREANPLEEGVRLVTALLCQTGLPWLFYTLQWTLQWEWDVTCYLSSYTLQPLGNMLLWAGSQILESNVLHTVLLVPFMAILNFIGDCYVAYFTAFVQVQLWWFYGFLELLTGLSVLGGVAYEWGTYLLSILLGWYFETGVWACGLMLVGQSVMVFLALYRLHIPPSKATTGAAKTGVLAWVGKSVSRTTRLATTGGILMMKESAGLIKYGIAMATAAALLSGAIFIPLWHLRVLIQHILLPCQAHVAMLEVLHKPVPSMPFLSRPGGPASGLAATPQGAATALGLKATLSNVAALLQSALTRIALTIVMQWIVADVVQGLLWEATKVVLYLVLFFVLIKGVGWYATRRKAAAAAKPAAAAGGGAVPGATAGGKTTTGQAAVTAAEVETCSLCLMEPSTMVFLPCRHRVLCRSCAVALTTQAETGVVSKQCTICREPFEAVLPFGDVAEEKDGPGGGATTSATASADQREYEEELE